MKFIALSACIFAASVSLSAQVHEAKLAMPHAPFGEVVERTVPSANIFPAIFMKGNGIPALPAAKLPAVAVVPEPFLLRRVETRVDVKAAPEMTDVGNSAYLLTGEAVQKSAGTFSDLPRYLHTLPGVVSMSDLQNAAVVRGGNPFENLSVIDGFEVPNINHLALAGGTGGMVSMLDTGTIDHATFYSSGYAASFNSPLSSVLDIHTLEAQQGFYAADLGFAGAGFRIARKVGMDSSLLVAARRSVVNYMTNDIGLNGTPTFSNEFAKYLWKSESGDRFTMDLLMGTDSLRMTPTWNDIWETNAYNTDYNGKRATLGMQWQKVHNADAMSQITVSDSEQIQKLSQYEQMQDGALNFRQNNREGTTQVKYSYLDELTETVRLQAGADLHLHRINYDMAQPLGLLSPYSTSSTPVQAFSANPRVKLIDKASFIDSLVHRQKFLLRFGFRYVDWGTQKQMAAKKQMSYLPSTQFTYFVTKRFSLNAGFARYAQAVPYATTYSVVDNYSLAPITDQHITAGASYILTASTQLTAEVYRKTYSNYPVASNYPQLSLANVIPNLGEAFSFMAMTGDGKGISQGVQIGLRQQQTHHVFADVNLALSRAQFAGLDGALRPGNWDYPVVLNVTGGVDFKRFLLTMRNTFTSGKVYTPILADESAKQNRIIYDLRQLNALRGPLYNRTDVALNRSFRVGNKMLDSHLGLQNLFDRENFYGYFWRPRCPQCGPIAEPSMGLMPDFGMSLRF